MVPDHITQLLLSPEHLIKMVIVTTGACCLLREGKTECTAPVNIYLPNETDTGTSWSSRKDHNKKSLKNMTHAIFKW